MKKTFSPLLIFSVAILSAPAALAQTPPPPAPFGTPGAEGTAAPAGSVDAVPPQTLPGASGPGAVPEGVPPLPPPAPAESAPPALDERVSALEGKVDGMDESLAATRSTADKLSRIKVSGYVQGRFEYHGDSANGVGATTGRPATTNQFLVRRGRVKTVYDGTNAEFLLQIDATGSGVVLKDAEATFIDTWSPFGLRLTVGQFKWPFGYEILQSSGDREMPERSLVIRRLFPGERDRGLRITGKYQWLKVAAALVNGTGSQDATYLNNDNNTFKDVVGRVGGDFEWLVVGLSGYWGRALATTLPSTRTSITATDANMDGTVSPDELTIGTTTVPASYRRFSRTRLGADAQLYLDLDGVGGLALKGEFVYAKDSNLSYGATAANACLDVTSIGWILTAVQNVGDYVGVVARFDSFDPNYSKALSSTCTAAQVAVGQGDRVDTIGGGLLLHGSGNIKATFTYEHVAEQNNARKNDVFTAQLQARF